MKDSSPAIAAPVPVPAARQEPSLSLIVTGFIVALFGLIGVAVFSYVEFAADERNAVTEHRTEQISVALGDVVFAIDHIDSAQRDYLISGDPSFLADYRQAVSDLPGVIDRLRTLLSDLPDDRRRLDANLPAINARLARLDDEVRLRQEGGHEAEIRERLLTGPDTSSEPDARSVLLGMREAARSRSAQLAEQARSGAHNGRQVLIVGDLASFALIVAVLVLFGEELRARRRIQEEAQRTAEEFDDLYNRGPFGYHSVDENGLLLRINDTELRWLGYKREEVIGRMRIYDLLAPEYGDIYRSLFPALMRGESQSVECEFRRRDGSQFPVLVRATAVRDASGHFRMSRTSVVDISKRKSAERQAQVLNDRLQASVEKLEAANRELESFSYSVSHDLRAPLRAIDGFSRIIERDHSNALDEEGKRLVGIVRASAKRMAQLIDDLLTLSRLSRHTLVRGVVDMGGLAREAAEEAVRAAEGSPAVDIGIGELPAAYGDKVLLRQVWSNLIGNAVKFSSKQLAPQVRITGYSEKGQLVYEVADNGSGFEMRYADRLFGIFQRLHSQEDFPGTGVGLAIVQRAIARHGGRIWAESEVGKGATFRFTLKPGEGDAQ